jgi:hypothetical protein
MEAREDRAWHHFGLKGWRVWFESELCVTQQSDLQLIK